MQTHTQWSSKGRRCHLDPLPTLRGVKSFTKRIIDVSLRSGTLSLFDVVALMSGFCGTHHPGDIWVCDKIEAFIKPYLVSRCSLPLWWDCTDLKMQPSLSELLHHMATALHSPREPESMSSGSWRDGTLWRGFDGCSLCCLSGVLCNTDYWRCFYHSSFPSEWTVLLY